MLIDNKTIEHFGNVFDKVARQMSKSETMTVPTNTEVLQAMKIIIDKEEFLIKECT